MKSIVSIINAGTTEYTDKEQIKAAVSMAVEKVSGEELIKPGMNILIKPNLVMDKNYNTHGGTDCLYTQICVIEAVVEIVLNKLKGKGSVVIGDAPMQECVFDNIKGLKELVDKYQGQSVQVSLVDFRELVSENRNGVHYSKINENAKGRIVNLGTNSEFYASECGDCTQMRITNYDPRILPQHHHNEIHEYYVSQFVLDSDLIINMPKPKTHRKGGVTISLKNLVGINIRKEFLPHHTTGSKEEGGDEYLSKSVIHKLRSKLLDIKNIKEAERKYTAARALRYPIALCSALMKFNKERYSEGSWYGNDTISKTIVDLNRIAIYADHNGVITNSPQRKMLIVADMIVSGEKEGPVYPSPKKVGMIAAGTNPVCFDEAISTLMGFDYKKISSISRARNDNDVLPIVSTELVPFIISNIKDYDELDTECIRKKQLLNFEPTTGWKGHIEITDLQ